MSTKISFNKVSPSKNNCSIIKLNNNNNNLFYNNNLNNKSSSFPIDNIPPPLYEENKNNKEIVENKNKLNIDENGKLFRQKGLSFKITLLNFLKTLVGAGFLALPLAFRNAGLWVLPMENKLKRPSQMLGPFGILSSGIFLASLVYSSIGFFGYVAYGDKIKGSITQNLPQHQMLVL
uniref:Aa_trans domain-containing protein n=1 Tax=Meloidogyne hapla TaxID=6305 RepID=A0A1I8BZZ8_MELHA